MYSEFIGEHDFFSNKGQQLAFMWKQLITSVCPTTVKDENGKIQQGNVTLLEISENEISVIVKGIYDEKIFMEKHITDWRT